VGIPLKIVRDSNHGQNPDNRDRYHHLDKGEAALAADSSRPLKRDRDTHGNSQMSKCHADGYDMG
jgi:hypothetical protein